MDARDTHLLTHTQGTVGRLTLNRPKALNALDDVMVRGLINSLLQWRDSPEISLILIDHKGGRGFCAGGDIRLAAEMAKTDIAAARALLRLEYQLNHLLFTYPKPIVSFMDGIVMGGGVGLARPCRWRVATDETRLAMPENAIGFVPDVGSGHYFSQTPGRMGAYMALTSARIDVVDCIAMGFATHAIHADKLPRIKDALCAHPDQAQKILDEAAVPVGPSTLMAQRPHIDQLFASDRLEDILAALEADNSAFAQKALAAIKANAPQSCKLSLRLLKLSRGVTDFAQQMEMEYRLAHRLITTPDFIEGVRAALIDKDRAPKWALATPEMVTDDMVEAFFAPLPPEQEWKPYA